MLLNHTVDLTLVCAREHRDMLLAEAQRARLLAEISTKQPSFSWPDALVRWMRRLQLQPLIGPPAARLAK